MCWIFFILKSISERGKDVFDKIRNVLKMKGFDKYSRRTIEYDLGFCKYTVAYECFY